MPEEDHELVPIDSVLPASMREFQTPPADLAQLYPHLMKPTGFELPTAASEQLPVVPPPILLPQANPVALIKPEGA